MIKSCVQFDLFLTTLREIDRERRVQFGAEEFSDFVVYLNKYAPSHFEKYPSGQHVCTIMSVS